MGIRPGEKLHEVMCPKDDYHLTLEFADHYMIQPAIVMLKGIDFTMNNLGEPGVPVPDEFEYNSGRNPHFLTVEELRRLDPVH